MQRDLSDCLPMDADTVSDIVTVHNTGPRIHWRRLRARLFEENTTMNALALLVGITPTHLGAVMSGRDTASYLLRMRIAYAIRLAGLDDGTVIISEGIPLPPRVTRTDDDVPMEKGMLA